MAPFGVDRNSAVSPKAVAPPGFQRHRREDLIRGPTNDADKTIARDIQEVSGFAHGYGSRLT